MLLKTNFLVRFLNKNHHIYKVKYLCIYLSVCLDFKNVVQLSIEV